LALLHELEVHQIELELQNEELISAKEQAEAATDKYIELYDFAPTCYFTLTSDGRISGLNLMASQLIGKERERLIGGSFGFYVSDETREQFSLFLEEVFQKKLRITCEAILTEDNQSQKCLHLTGMVTENGEHCLLTAVDITGQKVAEMKLQESEEKYRLLHEKAGLGIGYYKPDGTIISYNNLAAKQMNGIPEDFKGKSIYDIFTREEAELYHNRISKAAASDMPVFYEDTIFLPTGKYCFLSTFTRISDLKNNIIGIQKITQDITERKNAEDAIKKLLLEKDLLLKEVHHRIKNNMNTIRGLVSLQVVSSTNPLIISALHDTESRIKSMVMLYDKLYSSENYREMSVKDYLEPLAKDIVNCFPDSGKITINTEIDDIIMSFQSLSPLGIIVNELITNMMKYAFKGRESGVISITAAMKDCHAEVSIRDDGNGIPESVGFENSTGFGMGLVSMLTEQIEGRIRIERGRGTMFILEFDV
jgi:PAS domain S-box-containing protein